MSKTYFIRWHNADAGSWQDVLPARVIEETEPRHNLTHELVSPRDEVIIAHFDQEPTPDGMILLRYGGAHAAANKASGVYRGDVQLDPKNFATSKTLGWRDEGKRQFEPLRVTIWTEDVEGAPTTSTTRSSSRSVRLKAIKRALGKHNGKCEACSTQGHPGYGEARYACFEVHHRRALAEGPRRSGLEDLVYICANCHRAITALGEMPFEAFVAQLRAAD